MNKEKILESSRRENKNRDLAEMEVTAQAGNSAGRVGAAVCVVLTIIFRIFTKTYFLLSTVIPMNSTGYYGVFQIIHSIIHNSFTPVWG